MPLRNSLSGLAAFAVLAFLFVNARAVDESKNARVLYELAKLQELDSRLDKLVIELRSGLAANYDGLVVTLEEMKRRQRALVQGDAAIAGQGSAEIDAAMTRMSEQAGRRAALVEQFKFRNALLKNSIHYLPLSVDRLSRERHAAPALRRKAERLLRELLQLKIVADPADYEAASLELKALAAERGLHAPPVAARLDDVLLHAQHVVAHGREVGQLVHEISSVARSRPVIELARAYHGSFERELARANAYRVMLFLAGLVTLAYAANLFLQLSGTLTQQASEIRERRKAERRLEHMAQYDSLTGLPNRSMLHDRLQQALARADRTGRMVALLFLDLDRFKEINDTLGHSTGDQVLQATAAVLKRSIREADTVARLGGDEFTILLEDLEDPAEADVVAEKIKKALSVPVISGANEVFVSASIGVTLYPRDESDVAGLLKAADIAMYQAKERGRNTHAFYTPELNSRAAVHLQMEGLMRRALERGEFVLHYQPKVDVRSGGITGVEALIRWNSSELGLVSPAQFIPLAEKSGLIVPIGQWVLRTACAQARAWRDQGFADLAMSVNLSPRQFREKDLLEVIAGALAESGLEARLLELEITEGMIMEHPDKAIAVLQQIHRLGVQLSIDDFGTGYSSLAYLKRFPVQKLKIDRSFVSDIATDADDAAIVTAVVAMAQSLKLSVVAEGVENREQLAFLAKRGCHEYQGYYFSKPVAAADMTRLMERIGAQALAARCA